MFQIVIKAMVVVSTSRLVEPSTAGTYNEQRHTNRHQEILDCMALLVIGACSLRAQPVYRRWMNRRRESGKEYSTNQLCK